MGDGALRFVTDNDVDALVAACLREAGHEAWTAADAQLASASDAELAIYAEDQGAVLLSHDREFSQWRKTKLSGRHVWVRVPQPDAADAMMAHLDDLLPTLVHRAHVLVELRRESFTVHKPRWHDG